MRSLDEVLKQLEQTQGDPQAQAAVAAEFLIAGYPPEKQQALREALDAAAVLRIFDAGLLAGMLQLPEGEAAIRLRELSAMPFVEPYRAGGHEYKNVHEATRLGWRRKLAAEQNSYFLELSRRAAALFQGDAASVQIERIYHSLLGDPERAVTDLGSLARTLGSTRPEQRYALAAAVKELEQTLLLSGRARVWALLAIEWARQAKGELSKPSSIEREILEPGRAAGDEPAECEALARLGDILLEQGNLGEAQAAFAEYLKISRRLAELDPENAGWQRELAVSWSKTGDVLQEQGKLAEAQAAFAEYLKISRRLAELDPDNAGWQRGLAVSWSRTGDVLQKQGKLAEAQAAFAETLKISRRLAELDPDNTGWQGDVAVSWSRTGDVLREQGKLGEAQAAFAEDMKISRRLAALDPENAGWQRDVAVSWGRMGDVLQQQGKLAEAQAAFAEYQKISGRLAELDPDNAVLQRELAVSWIKTGDVLREQGKLAEARAAFAEYLKISRRLAELDPDNASWKWDLALACWRVADCEALLNPNAEVLPLYEEACQIMRRLTAIAPDVPRWQNDEAFFERKLAEARRRKPNRPNTIKGQR